MYFTLTLEENPIVKSPTFQNKNTEEIGYRNRGTARWNLPRFENDALGSMRFDAFTLLVNKGHVIFWRAPKQTRHVL